MEVERGVVAVRKMGGDIGTSGGMFEAVIVVGSCNEVERTVSIPGVDSVDCTSSRS